MKFTKIAFLKSATAPEHFPAGEHKEIAFVGRSNVGKSSLINHILQVKGLAKTSSLPGKTQYINFFSVTPALYFVDLPGYGYAKASREAQQQWQEYVDAYMCARPQLQVVVLLLDARRTLTEDDTAMLDWIEHRNLPVILILTKADKLTQKERNIKRQEMDSFLKITGRSLPYIFYSTVKNEGREAVLALLRMQLSPQRPS